uniref:Putative conserved secreted protein n=1 Tax=Lutzomyia longipalpis TaxID=7200 RepID=A0A1B0C8Z7_LUTLO
MKSCIPLLIAVFFIEVHSISSLQINLGNSSEPLSPVYVHTVTPLPNSAAEWPSQDITLSSSQIITAETPSEAPTEINFTSPATNKNNRTKSTVTNRTRTIQRLVGGHLQHQATRDRTRNDTLSLSDKFSKIYFRRKTSPSRNQPRNYTRQLNATTRRPSRRRPAIYKDTLDDAALLEVDSVGSNGIDNWDNGLLRASAGAGKEASKNGTEGKKKEEKAKTLSDQVAEGKYGLIQKEIFQKKPKRPGVISYLPNPDTPGDTNKTYGGLSEDDIWLAEDHLLVLKGGSLNKKGKDEWKPIDAYEAPLRQVKIPPNPEVPPPFPVQLEDNGPIEFIGNSQVPVFNPFANESLYLHPGAAQTPPPFGPNPPNIFTGARPPGNSSQDSFPYPPPIPPWFLNSNSTFANPFLNPPPFFGPGFPPPPFFVNGSLENVNITEFDEDDPSLYYPPPYSFVYHSNYTNPVPPGPLVPGIVLPPPPNFFSRLEGHRKTTTQSPVYPSRTTKLSKQTVKPAVTKLTTTTAKPPSLIGHVELHKVHIPRYKDRENVVVSFHPTTSTTPPPFTTTTTTTTPKPITTLKKIPTPNVVQFIPKIKHPSEDPFKSSNPIYFEYFDARKSPHTYLPPVTETTTTTPAPPPPPRPVIPIRTLGSREKPIQAKPIPVFPEHTTEPPAIYVPDVNGFDYDKYLYITPQPEIQPNGYTNFGPIGLNYAQQIKTPKNAFNQEIEQIRQTLKYYKSQLTPVEVTQLPRTPKAKAVYEYSFDAVEGSTLKPPISFNNPIQIDTTPFKPMVQYSPPLGEDINGFKPYGQSISPAYYTTTPITPIQYFRKKQSNRPSQRLIPILQASTENPLPTYYTKKETALLDDITKKYFNIFGQKLSLASEYATEPMSPASIEFTTPTPAVGSTTTPHWISIEKQVFRELDPQSRRPNSHRALNYYSRNIRPLPIPFDGYHYDRPESRPFPGFYANPTVDPYLRQIALIRQKLRQYPQQQQPQQQRESTQQYDLGYVNDTYVKYYDNRPNKENEYLAHQNPPPLPQYQHIVNAPNRYNNYFPPPRQSQQQEPQAPISLHKDTLVNYKYPLPAANPDSEYISPKLQPQQHKQHQYYNNRHYGNPVIQYQLGEQSHVYFITPQDNKYKD